MARPTNKKSLLELAESNSNKLLEFIGELPDEFKSKTFKNNELNERDKTIADVICHLHEWHLMMETWYKVGMSGKKPAIPAEGYTFQTLPKLNQRIWEKYKGTELKKSITMFKKSYKDVMALIEKHNDDELFTKKKYQWTGTTSLGSYFISATSSHYDWGLKTIKPLKKMVK
ncbi:MAG: ClbS/DfsB family four-helix bundle protein [Treponema sp.]|nr:ClbS/DfsB family four-helix bundle protein [Treponema sp.]